MLKGLGTGVNETTFVGDGSELVLLRRVPGRGFGNLVVVMGDVGPDSYPTRWEKILMGTIATRIAGERDRDRTFYEVMLPDGRVVKTCATNWEPVR
jgi:hypothetical protein